MLSCWQLYCHKSRTVAQLIHKTVLEFTDSKFYKLRSSVHSSCNNTLSSSWKHSCDFSRCELTRLTLCRAVSSPYCVRVSCGSPIDFEAPPVSTENTGTTLAYNKLDQGTEAIVDPRWILLHHAASDTTGRNQNPRKKKIIIIIRRLETMFTSKYICVICDILMEWFINLKYF